MAFVLTYFLFFIPYHCSSSSHSHTHSLSATEELTTTIHANEPTICDPNVQQYSGYLNSGGNNGTNNSYFYWFFESRNNPKTSPLTMWLQGGPGCSSQIALLNENGPCTVINKGKDEKDTALNPYSWNTHSNIIYVDQPPNTGFSVGSFVTSLEEVSKDMFVFLQHFIFLYPHYFANGFYIAGESYAGHYIPNIVHYIHQQNKAAQHVFIPLSGFAIGNGLTDPLLQFPYYAQMAYNSSTARNSEYEKLPLTKSDYLKMENQISNCTQFIKDCYWTKSDSKCVQATNCWSEVVFHGVVKDSGVNKYNLNVECGEHSLCYDFDAMENWLNLKSVQKELGVVPSIKWKSCNSEVRHMIEPSGDSMSNSRELLTEPLNDGIRGLIFAGDLDFICNYMGNEAWTLELEWNGKESFVGAKMMPWIVNGAVAGEIRQGNNENFTFLRVYDAGHMVPMDVPDVALEMIDQFLSNTLRPPPNSAGHNGKNGGDEKVKVVMHLGGITLINLVCMAGLLLLALVWGCILCLKMRDLRHDVKETRIVEY